MRDFSSWFTPRRQDLLWRIVIAAAVAVVFGRALFFDAWLPQEWGFGEARELFAPTAANFRRWFHTAPEEYLSPVAAWSVMFDHLVWCRAGSARIGDWFAFGVHLQNLFLHLAAALLVYQLGRELGCRVAVPAAEGEGKSGETIFRQLAPWSAAFAALFWAIHPQRAEAVVCLAGRRELLTAVLGLAALLLHLRAVRRGGGSAALMIAALPLVVAAGVSPWLVTFPLVGFFVLRAVESGPVKPLEWFLRLAPSIAAALATVVAQLSYFRWLAGQASDWLYALPAALRGATALRNLGNFFCRSMIPRDLVPYYPFYDPRTDSSFPVWVVLIVLFILGRFLRRHPEWSRPLWSIVWAVFFALLPVIGWFRPVPQSEFADRFTAWPAVFLWLFAAVVMEYIVHRSRAGAKHHLLISVLMLCIVLTGAFASQYKFCWRRQDGAAFVSIDELLRAAEEQAEGRGEQTANAPAAADDKAAGQGEKEQQPAKNKKKHANPHALIRFATVCWFKTSDEVTVRIARDHLDPEQYYSGYEQRAARSFGCAVVGMELVRARKFGEGGEWLLSVLDRPDWTHIRGFGIRFADEILRHAIVSQQETGNAAKAAALESKREVLKALSR